MKTKTFSYGLIIVLVLALVLPTGVFAAAPANDDFDNAAMINQFPFNDAISTAEATVAVDDPYCSGQAATVWYKFTATTNTTINANTVGSDYDTTLSVYTGSRGTLTQIACNDDYYGVQSFVQFSASAGETYYFMVSQYSTGGSGGSMVLTVNESIPPANDDVDNAITVGALPFTDTRDTSGATTAPDDPYCPFNGATVWYSFTPSANSRIDVNTSASNYSSGISVWTGPRDAWGYVACTASQRLIFDAFAGQTYYIMVGAWAQGGSLVLSVNESVPPVNDDIDNAIAINTVPFTDTRDTSAASTAPDDPTYCGYNGASVWYSITPDMNGWVDVDTSASNYYNTISVWTGPRGAWGNVVCTYSNYVRFAASAGQTYYIMVGTYGLGGSLSLSANLLPAPANDDVNNAIAIGSLPFSDTRDTLEASTASDDPTYCGYNGASVWYSFTPAADTRVELDSSASNYYNTISVWTGPRGAWSNVNCNYSNHIRFDALAGQTYYIMVGTYGNGGNLSLSATLAPPPLAIDVSINSTGSVKTTTGEATVKGTVTCNQTSYVNGYGYVQQKVGKGLIQGYVYFSGNCTPGTPFAWTSTLYSQPVQEIGKGRAATLFTAGKATAFVNAYAWLPYFYEYAGDNVTSSVTLKGTKNSYP